MSDVSAKVMQARSLMAQGKAAQARDLLARVLSRSPADADLNTEMAKAQALSGQGAQAVYYAQRAAAARPDNAAIQTLLGSLLMAAGRAAEALPPLDRAVSLAPTMRDALITRIDVLLGLERAGDAAAAAREALRHAPDEPDLHRALAYALLTSARCEEAVETLRAALAVHPRNLLLAAALATTLNYLPGVLPAEILEAHVAHARLLRALMSDRPASASPPPAPEPARVGGVLRIGLISADLRAHPVAFFVEPILEHLDRSAFDITCYATSREEDAVTARLKRLAGAWRQAAAVPDPELAARIRADRIDILIDLAGLTSGARPGTLLLRPAPVQATYLGYPATTGLTEVDARIVDARTDPPVESVYTTESLVRLDDCFLCYRPAPDAPDPSPPRGPDEPVTFGSFNAIQKLNRRVIDAWARILLETPGSTLVLKTTQLGDAGLRADVQARFGAAGVDPARIQLLGRTPDLRSHLDRYGQIDIALDPFPYNGTTTTCDALYMGVPVVSMVSEPGLHAGRVGLSLLTTCGLADLAAPNEAEYIRTALALARDHARDHARRAELRASLRARVLASPLCDGSAFAQRFGAALRGIWAGRSRAG